MTLCRHCLKPYEPNRVCSFQKKQDGNALCAPEPERKVSKSVMVKVNLGLARWVFPDDDWLATNDGQVVSIPDDAEAPSQYFDISDEHDLKSTLAKLLKHNWSIKETKRGGKPWYVAVKLNNEPGKPRTEDGEGHPDKAILISRIVQEITGERWD